MAASKSAPGSAVLASVPQSPEERRAALALLREGERCLHLARRLVTSVAILRGAAAEGLYEAQFAAPIAARTPASAAAPMPRPRAPAGGAAHALADCVAATRQDLIRALLAADPGTPGEEVALERFDPAFIACAPPGTRLQVDGSALRGLLAEALYRWSVVQRDGPASPWVSAPATARGSPTPAQAGTAAASH